MRLPLLLLCLAAAATASAQAPWGGLHFGQSRDAVRAQLANQKPPRRIHPRRLPPNQLRLPSPLPGLATPSP